MKWLASFESKVLLAFVAAVLAVCGLAGATWNVAHAAAQAAKWVAHTHEVLDSLARIRADTLQIEFNTQSFRISGDPARLVERDAAIASRELKLEQVRQLTRDNPQQQARWTQLRAVIDERLAISRKVEAIRQTEGLAAASAFVATVPLQATRERTYRLLRDLDEGERSLLERREQEQLRARQIVALMGVLVAVLLLALLATIYVLIRRQLHETQASERALADSEENLSTTLYSIGDAVLATDIWGCITRMNPVAEALTGWPIADAHGRPVAEVFNIVNEYTRAPAEIPVAQVLATQKIQELANHTVLIARDGSERPISDSAAPILDATGRMRGVVLVFRDVSTAHLAQQIIREQNAMLEQRVSERTAQLLASEDHLRSVINNVPALIAFVDATQRYAYVNQQYHKRFAAGRADIAGCTVHEILGDARYAIAEPLIAKVLQGEPQSYDWQPFPGVWQAIQYMPKHDVQGAVVGYYVLGSDITERKLAEEKIQALNGELEHRIHELEQVSRALKTLSAGNRAMLRATDEQALLENMCTAIVEAGGYLMASVWYRVEDEASSLRPMAESGHPGGLAALQVEKKSWADNEFGRGVVATAIRTGRSSVVSNILTDPAYDLWRAHLPGYACAAACPLQVDGVMIGSLAIYADEPDAFGADEVALLTESADDLAFGIATLRARSEQKKVQAAMNRLTHFDALTGLPNETYFAELLETAIETSQKLKQPFVVMQTNIERLSEINDALGFHYGDQMLKAFGARLRVALPESAVLARLRGDEFGILLPHSNASDAITMVERLDGMLTQPFAVADIALDVAAKIGVALFPEHGASTHDLMRNIDIAVHAAKKKGIRHVVFDPSQYVGQRHAHRLTLAGELRRAIEGGDLLLHLQPKVDVASGRVCGAEGLVRWQHAQRGLMPPSEFISLAEHTGLIKPLTEWVIEAGLGVLQDWERQGCAVPLAVNLSARNLREDNLLQRVRRLLGTWGVTPGLLEFEITESAVMDDAEFALRVLHGLREEGIPLYIDDFGTGYSSLSYLQKLPVEYIKIDQSFVRNLSDSHDSALIVRSTIDLAHDLGRKTVAEGVETQSDWDQLAAYGCDMVQGYFIAKPMPVDAFQAWRAQWQGLNPGPGSSLNFPQE